MKNKSFKTLLFVLLSCSVICSCHQARVSGEPEKPSVSKETNSTPQGEIEEAEESKNVMESENVEAEKKIVDIDYRDYFQQIDGCMVIYDEKQNKYSVYNQELANQQASPCSTFKVISGLIGLEEGVLLASDSKMNYEGTTYPIDLWNEDLTFKEAFQCSCVWYFKKVIDQVGQDKVAQYINDLHYGNCDLTEWEGSGINPTADTNGFWLESSLKVSPMEQVDVLSNIFQGETPFSSENINVMKEIMFEETNSHDTVYGKTGTGKNNAWYVGFFENDQGTYYFATRLVGNDTQNVSGSMAREITFEVIQQMNP